MRTRQRLPSGVVHIAGRLRLTTVITRLSHLFLRTLRDDPSDAEFDKLIMVCPAALYKRDPDTGAKTFDYAGCLECGTCKVACPPDALHWEYPRGGFGVIYRSG